MNLTPWGKHVRKFRTENNLSLGDMSKALGVKPFYLSRVEIGKEPLVENFHMKVACFINEYDVDDAVQLHSEYYNTLQKGTNQ